MIDFVTFRRRSKLEICEKSRSWWESRRLQIEQAILYGAVDVGITYLPSPDPELEFKEIGSFQMGLFGHKSFETKPFSQWHFAIPVTELKSILPKSSHWICGPSPRPDAQRLQDSSSH